jgi:hypothetical protein
MPQMTAVQIRSPVEPLWAIQLATGMMTKEEEGR